MIPIKIPKQSYVGLITSSIVVLAIFFFRAHEGGLLVGWVIGIAAVLFDDLKDANSGFMKAEQDKRSSK